MIGRTRAVIACLLEAGTCKNPYFRAWRQEWLYGDRSRRKAAIALSKAIKRSGGLPLAAHWALDLARAETTDCSLFQGTLEYLPREWLKKHRHYKAMPSYVHG